MLPDSELDNPAGLVLAFGAGATYDLTPRMFVSGEVGYRLGFQRTELLGETVDLGTSYLHVGLGAGARFRADRTARPRLVALRGHVAVTLRPV